MEKIIGDWTTEVRMSKEEAEKVCRLGQMDKCCAFLCVSANGFECIRMSYPMNGSIFDRLEKGTMNAKGEGGWKGCAWPGCADKPKLSGSPVVAEPIGDSKCSQ
jgi:hypothetical protein